MNTDNTYTSYVDFLRNKKFIQWQLMPDASLDAYWNNFICQYPEYKKEIYKAILFLKKDGLNKSCLNDHEYIILLNTIQKTILQRKKNKQRRFYIYLSASVAIAMIVIGITFFSSTQEKINPINNELIIGELLNNVDIQLITGGESILFHDDAEVLLYEGGTAEIVQRKNVTHKITIAKDNLNSLVVPYGKRSSLTLTDGSKVWLNSGTVIEFPAQFSGKNREIHLISGELYVEVMHDKNKPFFVKTDNFNVKVHGTKFNISSYASSSQSVILVEGSVSLHLSDKDELFLTPSDHAVFTNGTFDTKKVNVSQFTSWKDGYLSFDDTPMSEVLQQIGRYYNLSFNFENDVNLQNRSCSGNIYLSENLDNTMTTIALLSSTKYEKQDNKIYITNHY